MANLPKVFLSIETSRGFGRGLLRGIVRYSRLFGPWNFQVAHPFYYDDINKSRPIKKILGKLDVDGIIMRESSDLDEIIKIRAIQDFMPSKALSFVLQLKEVLREILLEKEPLNGIQSELRAFEKRIDDAALLAFDIYSQRVRKLYELRVNEINRQFSRLLTRANLVCEIPEEEREL